MAASRASLCPRGFGRASYHLMEALQMGLLPIHVYSDEPWLPYARVFARIGLASNLRSVKLMTHVATTMDLVTQSAKK